MGVRGDMAARGSTREPASKKGAMVYTSHVYEAPLLPFEKQLIETIGASEKEYRELVAYAIWKGRTRPAGYEHIPDIRADVTVLGIALAKGGTLTVAGSLVVGAALTLAGYLLTPKPKMPDAIERRILDSINKGGRFTPTQGFDSLAEIANYGDPIPIIFGKYHAAQKAGGMLVTPRMVWSRMFSLGSQQGVKMMYSIGEQGVSEGISPDGIGTPNLAGIFIGNNALDAIYNDSFAFYWKRNTTTSGKVRILKENKAYGTSGDLSAGDISAEDDVFLCPTSEGTSDEGFCSAHSLSNNAEFGCYAPIRNGTTFRVNWSTIPIPHISDGNDDDPHPYVMGYERFKIAGDKVDGARQAHDGNNRTQNQGMPGEGRNYSCRMGIVDYYKGGTRYQSRTGNGTTDDWIPIRVYNDVQKGDECLFVIRPQSERCRSNLYADGKVKIEDINSTVDEMRRAADEQMQIGELFIIGACIWKVKRRSETIWGAVDLKEPESDVSPQYIHLECIDNNGGIDNNIGVVSESMISPNEENIRNTKKVSAGAVTDREDWLDQRGGSYGPVDGDGFIGDSPEFGSLPGSSFYPLMRVSRAVIRNNRKCDVTEIGLKSTVYQQINGLCNFQSLLTVQELKDLDGDGRSVQSGTLSSFIQRASAFVIKWRESGSQTDDITGWTEFPQKFVVVGGTSVAQYHWIRIKHPRGESAYEYQISPINGSMMKEYSDDLEFYQLGAAKTNSDGSPSVLSFTANGFTVTAGAQLTKKKFIKDQPEFRTQLKETTYTEVTPAKLTVEIKNKLPTNNTVSGIRRIGDFENPNDSQPFMKVSDSSANAGKMGSFTWEIFGSADSGTYGGAVGVGGTVTKDVLYTINNKPVRITYRATKLLLGGGGPSSWHGQTHGWRVGYDDIDGVDSFESNPQGGENEEFYENEVITVRATLSSGNPFKSNVPGTSGDLTWSEMRLRVKLNDRTVSRGRGLAAGIPYEIFGAPGGVGEKKTVRVTVADSGMSGDQDGNLLEGRTITLDLSSEVVALGANWAGQESRWEAPTIEVVSTTGTWGAGDTYNFEYLLRTTDTTRTRNSVSITRNPWRRDTNENNWIGYLIQVTSYVPSSSVEKTKEEAERTFEQQTFYADVSRYGSLVRKSNESSPEHVVAYVNETLSNPKTPEYDAMTIAGLSLKASRNFSSLDQIRVWMSEGLHVERLHPDKTAAYENTDNYGPSSMLTDLVYYLITDEIAGAAASFGGSLNAQSLVDKDELIKTSRFLTQYQLYYNGALTSPTNLRQFISDIAPNFLCTFTLKNGKFSIQPALPVHSDGRLRAAIDGAVDIKQYFTSGNILEDSFEVSYLEAEERKPFKAVVRYRHEVKNQLPKEKTLSVFIKGQSDKNGTDLPIETFDLTGFCTTENHAKMVAKYFLQLREKVTHTISFKTTPYGLDLGPGDYIKCTTSTAPYDAAKNGTIDGSGSIVSTSTINDGEYQIFYYPTAADQDIQTGTMRVDGNKTIQSEFFSSVFTIQETTNSTNIYRVEQITLEEDATVAIVASEFPCNENDASLIAIDVDNDNLFEII